MHAPLLQRCWSCCFHANSQTHIWSHTYKHAYIVANWTWNKAWVKPQNKLIKQNIFGRRGKCVTKQMPWSALTFPTSDPSVLSSMQKTCSRTWENDLRTMLWSALHQLLIINKATYLGVLSLPIFTGPFSSVRANEQMLLCCWSQYDGRCCWQRHPSAERTCQGVGGGVIWTVNSLPGCLDFTVSLTFFLQYDWPHQWHSGIFYPPST